MAKAPDMIAGIEPPKILPLAGEIGARPFWSVMIPAYNPSGNYLEQTLRGILTQDPGPEQMQIEVVDDCSPKVDVVALVRKIAGDRVKVSQTPGNLGLAGCWNTCIERARGEWVHILHQDDLVFPGFYRQLGDGIMASPEVGAAFCRHAFVAADNHWVNQSPLEQPAAGVLKNFNQLLARGCVLQCPSIVVKRSAYEKLGGYSLELKYALDWEMWLRIAAQYSVWYEPTILACYRTHGGSETGKLVQTGQNLREISCLLKKASENLERQSGRKILCEAKTANALKAISTGEMFLYRSTARPQRNFKAAWNQLVGGFCMRPSFLIISAIIGVMLRFFWAMVRRLFTHQPANVSAISPAQSKRR